MRACVSAHTRNSSSCGLCQKCHGISIATQQQFYFTFQSSSSSSSSFSNFFFRSPVQSLILSPLTYCANTFYKIYEITTASLCNTRNASTSPFYSRKLVMKMNYSNFNRVFGWEKLHYAAIGFGCEVAKTQLHTVEMNNWHFSKAFSIIWFIDVPFSICRLQLQSFIFISLACDFI